jgi:hypothetical protein
MTDVRLESHLEPAAADLLLVTARSVLTPDDRARLRAALAAIVDWTAIIAAALAHGTAGMLCHHMLAAGPDLLPDEIAEAAATYLSFRETEHQRAANELAAVLDALTSAGVPALPYKGPVLAAMCYPEPHIRGCRDLDFLIHERDIEATMAALARLGYRSLQSGLSPRRMRSYFAYNGQDVLLADGRMPVEPHWRLNPRTLCADIDTGALFRRSGTIAAGGHDVPAPSREDTLLICGMHGSKEQWSRLVWIADMAEQLRAAEQSRVRPPLDWTAILNNAGSAGVRRMLLAGIALAERMLLAPVPVAIEQALTADPVARRLAAETAEGLFARGGHTPTVYRLTDFRLRMRERRLDRIRYIFATLLTARAQHFRFIDLPAGLSFLYPFVRLGHDYVALPLWRLAHSRAPGSR